MANFDTSTPQLEAVKSVFDAFSSINLSKVGSLLSKNFQYDAFNEVTELAKLNKEELAKSAQRLLTGMTKLDVSIQRPTAENHLQSHRLMSNP